MVEKHKTEWRVIVGRVTGILVLLSGILLAAGLCNAASPPDNSVPASSIHARPLPSRSYHLSRFVLAITGVISWWFFGLLTYATGEIPQRQCEY